VRGRLKAVDDERCWWPRCTRALKIRTDGHARSAMAADPGDPAATAPLALLRDPVGRAFQRLQVAVALLAPALLVCACAQRTGEVAKGDAEYPVEDSTAHFVPLTVVMPQSLRVSFAADYAAQENLAACLRPAGPGVRHAISLQIPLPLVTAGELQRGSVSLDRFLPGRCGWFFTGVSYWVEGGGSSPQIFVRYIHRPGNMSDVRADVWCFKDPNLSPGHHEVCSDLSNLIHSSAAALRPEFLATVPDSERGNGRPVLVDTSTHSIAVYFHDLDTMPARRAPGGTN